MKNFKPFVLGCLVGCGVMFVALQYHIVQSHDGFQLVPRTPQAALGLAWVDVRGWKAEQWTDRPELARALVAHGASDLIAESVTGDLADSLDPDSGTIEQLRSFLNDSDGLSSDLDAPLFPSGESDEDDGLAIPFPQEAKKIWQEESLTRRPGHSHTDIADRTRTRLNDREADFDSGFGWFEEATSPETEQNGFSEFREAPQGDLFQEEESRWGAETRSNHHRSPGANADERRRETTMLEDLLFAEDHETEQTPRSSVRDYGSLTQALDSRAAQALDRARGQFRQGQADADTGGSRSAGRYARDNTWTGPVRSFERSSQESRAIRSLRDRVDPFLD